MIACAFGLVFAGSVGGWLARQAQAPKYEGQDFHKPAFDPSQPFDELPGTHVTAGTTAGGSFDPDAYLSSLSSKDATAAYNSGDYATALRLFRPLAEQGDAPARFYVGWMYANGRSVPKNDAEAARWYRLAADQGLAGAQYNLGLAYADGSGVPKNEPEAVKW